MTARRTRRPSGELDRVLSEKKRLSARRRSAVRGGGGATTWDTFFSAEVGAAAALTGLIFVGLSINLSRILSLPQIANRALQALLLLIAVLGVDTVVLVPGLSLPQYGLGVVAISLALWAAVNELERRNWKVAGVAYRALMRQHTVEIQVPCALLTLAGVAFLLNTTEARLWLVPATLVSYLVTVIEAWIILVEINR